MAEMGKGTGERWCAPHHPMQAVRNHKYLGHPFSTGGGGHLIPTAEWEGHMHSARLLGSPQEQMLVPPAHTHGATAKCPRGFWVKAKRGL